MPKIIATAEVTNASIIHFADRALTSMNFVDEPLNNGGEDLGLHQVIIYARLLLPAKPLPYGCTCNENNGKSTR